MRHQRNVHGKAGIPSSMVVAEKLTPPPQELPPPQEFTPPPQEFLPPPQEFTPPPLQEVSPTLPTQPSVTVTSQQRQECFVFKHPFTANISVPTCCGRTYFCKMLLQHCLKMIWHSPERIVWLYKRWQPLYDVIQSTVYPTDLILRRVGRLSINQRENPSPLEQQLHSSIIYISNRKRCRPRTIAD